MAHAPVDQWALVVAVVWAVVESGAHKGYHQHARGLVGPMVNCSEANWDKRAGQAEEGLQETGVTENQGEEAEVLGGVEELHLDEEEVGQQEMQGSLTQEVLADDGNEVEVDQENGAEDVKLG